MFIHNQDQNEQNVWEAKNNGNFNNFNGTGPSPKKWCDSP